MEVSSGYEDPSGFYRLNYPTLHPSPPDRRRNHDPAQYLSDRKIQKELSQAVGRIRGILHDSCIHLLSAFSFVCRNRWNCQVNPSLIVREARVDVTADHK